MQMESLWLVLLGPPFSGKGQDGKELLKQLLARGFRAKRIVMSEDVLKDDPTILAYKEAAKLVPDDIVIGLASRYLDSIKDIKKKILVLDGFGRKTTQMAALYQDARALGCRIVPVYINTPLDVCFQRALKGRTNEDGTVRKDDDINKVPLRIEEYSRDTAPVIVALEEQAIRYIEVIGNPPIEDEETSIRYVVEDILTRLEIYISNSMMEQEATTQS